MTDNELYNRRYHANEAIKQTKISHPSFKFIARYRFKTIVTDHTNPKRPIVKAYTRKVEIIFLGKIKELLRFQLLCTAIDFEGERISSSPFLKEIAYVFDEVEISADEEGNIIELHNLRAMAIRWEKIKAKLLKDNEGTEMMNYFKNVDKVLNSEQEAIKFLSNYNMYGLYFNGCIGNNENHAVKSVILKDNEEHEIVIKTSAPNNLFDGHYFYTEGLLSEAILETTEGNNHIKYTALCLGLKKASYSS
ncbi:hypothetical protein [uncultured Flavobacterium sp.]|uniref:hypothetical protein n=1 Tax=uncultured Flavobacterium sp. TaxID=165435 RepID=UPI0025F3F132|nr:hypothetical protein [uncultured Flavobacterium sp.]